MNRTSIKKKKFIILIAMAIFFALEYFLFKAMYLRDMQNGLPTMTDQISYITQAYRIFEQLRNGDWGVLRREFEAAPNGALLPIFGALNMGLMGISRYSLIILNFWVMALTQILCGWCFYKLTRKEEYILLFSGLFLMVDSIYYWAGSIYDFRLDFGGMCLFTCWLTVLLYSEQTNSKKGFYLDALISGITVMYRPIIAAYIGFTVVIYEIIKCSYIHQRNVWGKELIRWLKYVGAVLLVSGYYLITNLKDLWDYYSIHFYQPEKEIRDIEFGVENMWTYYAKSLFKDHLWDGLIFITTVSILSAIIFFILYRKKIKGELPKILQGAVLILSSIVCTWFLLTIHATKSPVVINVIAGCFVVLAVYFVMQIENHIHGKVILKYIFCAGVVCVGLGHYMDNTITKNPTYVNDEQMGLIRMHNAIAEYFYQNKINDINMLTADINMVYDPMAFQLYYYEKKHEWINISDSSHQVESYSSRYARDGGSTIMQVGNNDELKAELEISDIIIISPDNQETSLYPRQTWLNQNKAEIYQYATEKMDLVCVQRIGNYDYYVFIKNMAFDLIAEPDGWITAEGSGLEVETGSSSRIVLKGITNSNIDTLTGNCYDENGNPVNWDITYKPESGEYQIEIELTGLEPGKHKLSFQFDQYFCPSDISESTDDRKLVVSEPYTIYYE